MKQKLESKLELNINEETTFFQRFKHGVRNVIAGTTLAIFLAATAVGCASLKHYVEPRIGAIIPIAEQKKDYEPSYLVGGAYGFNKGKFGLEAGLDYFHSAGEYIKTNSFLPRLNVSYSPRKQKAKVKPYLTAGASLLSEFSAIDIPEFGVHDKVSNTTFGLETGVGVTIFDRINARVTYTMMPTSENVKGMISLMGGYRFRFGGKK